MGNTLDCCKPETTFVPTVGYKKKRPDIFQRLQNEGIISEDPALVTTVCVIESKEVVTTSQGQGRSKRNDPQQQLPLKCIEYRVDPDSPPLPNAPIRSPGAASDGAPHPPPQISVPEVGLVLAAHEPFEILSVAGQACWIRGGANLRSAPCAAVGDVVVGVNGRTCRGAAAAALPGLFAAAAAPRGAAGGGEEVGAEWVRLEVLSARRGTAATAVAGDCAPYPERPRHVYRHAFMLRRGGAGAGAAGGGY